MTREIIKIFFFSPNLKTHAKVLESRTFVSASGWPFKGHIPRALVLTNITRKYFHLSLKCPINFDIGFERRTYVKPRSSGPLDQGTRRPGEQARRRTMGARDQGSKGARTRDHGNRRSGEQGSSTVGPGEQASSSTRGAGEQGTRRALGPGDQGSRGPGDQASTRTREPG
jgi:hypothetical protein